MPFGSGIEIFLVGKTTLLPGNRLEVHVGVDQQMLSQVHEVVITQGTTGPAEMSAFHKCLVSLIKLKIYPG